MQNNLPVHVQVPVPATMQPTGVATYLPIEDEHDIHLRDYWHILLKRKWWFFGVLSGIMLVTLLVTFLMSPIYMGTTTLQIIQDNPSALLGGSNSDPLGAMTGSSELDRFYETQYGILQSLTLAYGLIDTLKLKDHPSYKQFEKDNKGDPPEVVRQKYAQDMLDHMKVEPVKNSFLVNISFKSTDRNLARQVPESIQKEYLKLAMATRQQSYVMIKEWLDGELTRLGKKLENSETSVFALGQQNDFLSMEEGQFNVVVQKYVDLGKLLTTAQSERAGKEAQYRQIVEKGADAPLITGNPLIQNLRNQLIGLEGQISGSSQIFGDKYPERKATSATINELRQRIGQEVKRLETSIKADYGAAAKAEALIQKDFDLAKAKVIDMQNGLVPYHMLKRDLQTNQTLYEGLLGRMKDASIAATMVSSNISVITAAETPYKPWMPKPVLFIALSAAIGALAGIATAFFVEYLDSSIKSAEELEKISRLSALGVVPMGELKEVGNDQSALGLVTHTNPGSMVSEAFFHIRTAIMLSSSDGPPRVLTITSANPSEGKTTTSLNIAVTLAGKDRKCIVLDCDLRKPKAHTVFKVSNRQGLANFLTGNAKLEEVIHPTAVPNLYFIPAGPVPPNPNELFASTAFEEMVTRLRKEYDHIILDSPPIIGFADARSLAARADGTVLVFKHHSTTRDAARLAIQLLQQNNCRILGGVLTMARKDRLGYGGYYQYYHYYNKYYKDYHDAANGGKDRDKKKLAS
ncbi:MAG: polysaccharide biosynthesis tyrosine autokinase [Syntrophobacteraceae bacterium]